MEPNQSPIEQIEDDIEKPFCDRPYEKVEDGYIDDRGFYTTPNGSFWDDDETYFNHLGFDRHGGSYDKYGVYHPGPDYDEKTGLYKDQKDLLDLPETINENIFGKNSISKLKEQQKKDENTIKKYEQPVEESEEEDDEDKSNVTFDEKDFEEAYDAVMENEDKHKKNMDIKLPVQNENLINNA